MSAEIIFLIHTMSSGIRTSVFKLKLKKFNSEVYSFHYSYIGGHSANQLTANSGIIFLFNLLAFSLNLKSINVQISFC